MTHLCESDSTLSYTNEYANRERVYGILRKTNVIMGQKNTVSRALLTLSLGNCNTIQKITTPRMPHIVVPGANAIPSGFSNVLLTPPNPSGFNSVLLYGDFALAFSSFITNAREKKEVASKHTDYVLQGGM